MQPNFLPKSDLWKITTSIFGRSNMQINSQITAWDLESGYKNHTCKGLWRRKAMLRAWRYDRGEPPSIYIHPVTGSSLLIKPDCAHPLLTPNSQHAAFLRRDRSCLIPSSSEMNWFSGAQRSWNSAIRHMLRAWFTLIRTAIYWPFVNRASLVFTLNRLKSDTNCCPRTRNANFLQSDSYLNPGK